MKATAVVWSMGECPSESKSKLSAFAQGYFKFVASFSVDGVQLEVKAYSEMPSEAHLEGVKADLVARLEAAETAKLEQQVKAAEAEKARRETVCEAYEKGDDWGLNSSEHSTW